MTLQILKSLLARNNPQVFYAVLPCFAAEHKHTKLSWFIVAVTCMLKSQIDESVLCIISDVFAAVEICATAK